MGISVNNIYINFDCSILRVNLFRYFLLNKHKSESLGFFFDSTEICFFVLVEIRITFVNQGFFRNLLIFLVAFCYGACLSIVVLKMFMNSLKAIFGIALLTVELFKYSLFKSLINFSATN